MATKVLGGLNRKNVKIHYSKTLQEEITYLLLQDYSVFADHHTGAEMAPGS